MNTKSICIILPGVPSHPSGGYKIAMEYANRISKVDKSVKIRICFWCVPEGNRLDAIHVPRFINKLQYRARILWHPRWFRLTKNVHKSCIFSIDDKSIRSDCVIATSAATANPVSSLKEARVKAYLIQDFENWDLSDSEVRSTYRLGMKNIVVSNWLKEIVEEESGELTTCIPNPIDTTVFFKQPDVVRSAHTVSVLYHPGKYKGFDYAWKAIVEAKKEITDLNVLMFGTCQPPDDLPKWVSYTRDATPDKLRRIYSGSAVYVCASINEGFGLTCVEAMACGCVLVVTDFLGSREYAINGRNSLVSPVCDANAMALNIVRVLTDDVLRSRIASYGMTDAHSRNWDDAIRSLLCAINYDGNHIINSDSEF